MGSFITKPSPPVIEVNGASKGKQLPHHYSQTEIHPWFCGAACHSSGEVRRTALAAFPVFIATRSAKNGTKNSHMLGTGSLVRIHLISNTLIESPPQSCSLVVCYFFRHSQELEVI
jgi:hypothetical protein